MPRLRIANHADLPASVVDQREPPLSAVKMVKNGLVEILVDEVGAELPAVCACYLSPKQNSRTQRTHKTSGGVES